MTRTNILIILSACAAFVLGGAILGSAWSDSRPAGPALLSPRFQFLTRGDDLILGDTCTADAWLFTASSHTSLWIQLPNPLRDTNRVLHPSR